MDRDSMVFYRSFYEALKELDMNVQGEVYNSIFKYQFENEENELKGISKSMFTLIKPQIDANNKRYENGCKGGRPKNQIKTETKPMVIKNDNQTKTETKPNENENENVNENVNENDIYTPSEAKTSSGDVAKASKHKYGEYKNVLLKDEELQALKKDFSNWEELIKYLDEYIEMKGYKAKSHYLAIRKWVVNAVKRNKIIEDVKETKEDDVYEQLRKSLIEKGEIV